MPPAIPSPGAGGSTIIGMRHIDSVLFGGGGVPQGVVMDIFGRHGTGKTQMLMQAASRFAACGRRVLYVDTAGTFRPERVVSMAGAASKAAGRVSGVGSRCSMAARGRGIDGVLQMISVARIQNVSEQLAILERLSRGLGKSVRSGAVGSVAGGGSDGAADRFDLVIIDSLTDLFSYEYSRYGDLRERNSMFLWYVRGLARLAVRGSVTIMVSNMVRTSSDGTDAEIMAAEIGLCSHVRIHLTKKDSDSSVRKSLRGYASCAVRDNSYGVYDNDNSTAPGRGAQTGGGPGGHNEDCDVAFSYEITSSGIETRDEAHGGRPDLP